MCCKVNELFVKNATRKMPRIPSIPVILRKRKRILVRFPDRRAGRLTAILNMWRVFEAESLIKNGSGKVGRYTAG